MQRFAIILTTLALWPAAAVAQQEQAPPGGQRVIVRTARTDYRGLTLEDRAAYCFWAGQIYSIGSAFCTRQQTLTTCTASGNRPIWVSKDNDKLCDRNTSLTPQ